MFDPTVTLGNVLTMLSIIVSLVYVVAGVRADLQSLKNTVADLSQRMARHEEIIFQLSRDLQRVIGRIEVQTAGKGPLGP